MRNITPVARALPMNLFQAPCYPPRQPETITHPLFDALPRRREDAYHIPTPIDRHDLPRVIDEIVPGLQCSTRVFPNPGHTSGLRMLAEPAVCHIVVLR